MTTIIKARKGVSNRVTGSRATYPILPLRGKLINAHLAGDKYG